MSIDWYKMKRANYSSYLLNVFLANGVDIPKNILQIFCMAIQDLHKIF
jgi:hypothetical protein